MQRIIDFIAFATMYVFVNFRYTLKENAYTWKGFEIALLYVAKTNHIVCALMLISIFHILFWVN